MATVRHQPVLHDGSRRRRSRLVARFGQAIVGACRVADGSRHDVNTDPRFADAGASSSRRTDCGVRRRAADQDGRWLATFGVHSATPRTWTRDQIVVEVAAERTWGPAAGPRRGLGPGEPSSIPAPSDRHRRRLAVCAHSSQTCRLLRALRVNRVAYGEVDGDDCIIVDDYVDGVPSMSGHVQWRNLTGSRANRIVKAGLSVNDTSTESPPGRRGAGAAVSEPTLSAAGQGRPLRRRVRNSQPLATGVDARRDCPRSKSPIGPGRRSRHRKAEAELRANEGGWRFFSG